MRLLISVVILLAFPVLELAVLLELGARYGAWVLVYLLIAAVAGFVLVRGERTLFFVRMVQALQHGQHPWRALLSGARNVVAGVLLILPGVISDVLALLLLLVPVLLRPTQAPPPEAGVIEGEWRREE